MYRTLVRAGGMIGVHDIAEHPDHPGGDAPRFWRELREYNDVMKFVENWYGGWGIGVVKV